MEESDEATRDLLTRARTIAVVGLSDNPERDSHGIAKFLQLQGYRIVPVNPKLTRVLGETAYPSLTAIPPPVKVDIVDIFRRSEEVESVVDAALQRGVGAVWMQLGVSNEPAAAKVRARGLPVYQNRCIMVEHRRLRVPSAGPPTGS
ncbi:MAG: CoA-binding protein [Thermoplasmata archaeon]|nr:CoA-binding protein [Thermoplasmata archaeon]